MKTKLVFFWQVCSKGEETRTGFFLLDSDILDTIRFAIYLESLVITVITNKSAMYMLSKIEQHQIENEMSAMGSELH